MRLVPPAISRKVASQALLARKNSPTILLGAGVVSMVGSTVLACRATLKVDAVLSNIESEKNKASLVKEQVDSGDASDEITYSDREYRQDTAIILARGAGSLAKLYAPSIILGGVGIVCLTKSHSILQNRNTALTAAYLTVDRAFTAYRERVVDRYGEDVDRELRHGSEKGDLVNEETGKVKSVTIAAAGEPSGYARWFDGESSANWSTPEYMEYNWQFLRTQQNWANDMLHRRGHMTLNEVFTMLGLSHTSAGAVVGWIYSRDNEIGDNQIDFGCWDQVGNPLDFANGREGAILLDFNVDGPVWAQIDDTVARNS